MTGGGSMLRRGALIAVGVLVTTATAACAPAVRSSPASVRRASPTPPSPPAGLTRVVGSPVSDVTFVSATHGWALTAGRLYETTDAGRHWRPTGLPSASVSHVRFVDATVGYAWDANGVLWLTTDDGHSWDRGGLGQVDSLEASAGVVWAIAGPLPYGNVWRSDVASTSWTKLDSTPNRSGTLLPHGRVTYVLGEQGAGPVLPSYDVYVAGREVGNRPLPCEPRSQPVQQSPMAVSTDGSLFLVCDLELASGEQGRSLAYASTDRGRTWTPIAPPPKPASGVAAARGTRFAWDLDLWAYRGGRWRLSLPGPTGPPGFDLAGFNLVGFQDDTHAIALTTTGQLYLTSDAGLTWRLSALPTRLPAHDCQSGDLRVQGGRQGSGFGTAHVDIEITNAGTHACALPSPSALDIVDSSGKRLPLEILDLDTAAEASAVALPRGGHASLALSWENWCGRDRGPLRIELGVDRSTLTGTFDGPPDYDYWPGCVTQGKMSMLQVLGPYTVT